MAEAFDSDNASTIDLVLAEGVFHLLAAKYFMLASFVILVYDHAITFSQEVDRIWRREWSGATWLFALNRYLTELQFIVNLVSFHDPSWTGKACEDFIPFAGVSTLVSVAIAELVLVLRTYALYQRSKVILALLSAIWCGQVIVMATTMTHPIRIPLPAGLIGCIMGAQGQYAAAFWLAPLVMDGVITGLTVFKTMQYLRQQHGHVQLIHVILRDGLLYFAVILVANLSNCLAYYLAPPDLKVIGASFSQIVTIIMISRLQLNLRSSSICSQNKPVSQFSRASSVFYKERKDKSNDTSTFTSSLSNFFASTVADLGKDIGAEREDDVLEKTDEVRVKHTRLEDQIEMGPIRPVSGGTPAHNLSIFSSEETEWLQRAVQVSPGIVKEE